MERKHLLILLLLVFGLAAQAQNERKYVRQGNKYYEAAIKDTSRLDTAQFNRAEIEYRKAIEKKPDDPKWNFNLANSLYKQQKVEESAEQFKEIADRTTNKIEKSRALHNLGNSLLMNNKLDESIEAYKNALRNNPNDLETKYNLLYAMNMKKKQEEEQKKQDQNKDKNKDQDKDKDQQNKDQKKDQDKQQQQQQPSKISKQNAEQMLQALENEEKKIQEKVKKVQALKAQSKKVEKDW